MQDQEAMMSQARQADLLTENAYVTLQNHKIYEN